MGWINDGGISSFIFEPLTSLSCPLNGVFHVLHGPVLQDAGKPLLLLLQIFNLSIISIAVVDGWAAGSLALVTSALAAKFKTRTRASMGPPCQNVCGENDLPTKDIH
jgi:hypothetical protein